jgi:hypothetical protein
MHEEFPKGTEIARSLVTRRYTRRQGIPTPAVVSMMMPLVLVALPSPDLNGHECECECPAFIDELINIPRRVEVIVRLYGSLSLSGHWITLPNSIIIQTLLNLSSNRQ